MSALASPLPLVRKPPTPAQYNWITGNLDIAPEQIELPLPAVDDIVLPHDDTVTLLATENGSQLFISGFGLYVGKKSERVVVRKDKSICAQVPFMRLQEIIIASRGVSFSSDLLEELCERGIRVACPDFQRQAVRADHFADADRNGGDEAPAQLAAVSNERGAQIFAAGLSPANCTIRKSCCAISLRAGKARGGKAPENGGHAARIAAGSAGVWRESARVRCGPTLMGLEGTGARMYWKRSWSMLPDGLGFEGEVIRALRMR